MLEWSDRFEVSALPYDDAEFSAPPTFGPFRVLHQIGSGTLGPVFRAVDDRHARLVTVKVLRLDLVPEAAARVSETLQRLVAHPASAPVVRVVGVGQHGATPYLVYEHLPGESLDLWLRRHGALTPADATPLVTGLADAVAAAWETGVGFGSLHPRDVLIEGGRVAGVTGAGVASALEREGLRPTLRRPYAAPERVAGLPCADPVDVYAAAVLIAEVLTGRRPASVADAVAGLSADWASVGAVLTDALAEVPAGRPTAAAFAAAVRQACGVSGTVRLPEAEAPQVPTVADRVAAVQPVAVGAAGPVASHAGDVRLPRTPAPSRLPAVGAARHGNFLPVDRPDAGRLSWAWVPVVLCIGIACGYWWRGAAPATGSVTSLSAPAPATDVAVVDPGAPEPVPPPPAEAPAVEGPVAPARGRLLVRSEPAGARIVIGGRARGTTPAAIRDLPFGTYNVAVSRQGYQSQVRRVTVSRAVPSREITLSLRPATPAGDRGTGAIYVDSRPTGAQVSLDGRILGTTPMRIPELAPGSYALRLEKAGHKTLTTAVAVRAGQQVPVRVSLEVM